MDFSSCMRDITNNGRLSNSNAHGAKTPGGSKRQGYQNGSFMSKSCGQSPASAKKFKEKTRNITPSRNTNFSSLINAAKRTPGGDRYISSRASEAQQEMASYLMQSGQRSRGKDSSCVALAADSSQSNMSISAQKAEYERLMSDHLNGGVTYSDSGADDPNDVTVNHCRILRFEKSRPPLAPKGFANSNAVVYTAKPTCFSSHTKCLRYIPPAPVRILDAPDIIDDYYLNLLDWSQNNKLAVALTGQVFLWDPVSGNIDLLLDLNSTTDYVSSVSWVTEGNYLAVGCSDSTVMLYDVETQRRLRVLRGHTERVGALSWNVHVLSSGDKSGQIHNHDVRVADPLINVLRSHTQEVCGLKWSPNGRYLASGGNDNFLNIWQQAANGLNSESTPLHTCTDHQAAVKALAWCPWQPHLLASGGGTADRHIRLWNCVTGECLSSHDTQSQVCSLLWSNYYRELLSGHGYPNYQLILWKYPEMRQIVELKAHEGRILHTAMSPCGEYVVSAAADETLRIWHCFKVDPDQKKKAKDAARFAKPKSVSGTLQISSLR